MRKCSRCGKTGPDLHLVTIPQGHGPAAPGRLLVYCWECRLDASRLGVSIPADLVTESLFLSLYETGRTTSAPDIAADIAFGEERGALAERAAELMAARNA